MFESVLNGLIKKFLEPYLEGISGLSIGLGSIELRNVKLKRTLFAAIGVDVLELEHGEIGFLSIGIPLRALVSGEIKIALSDLKIVVRSRGRSEGTQRPDQEMLAELRENRSRRLEARTERLLELSKHQALAEAMAAEGTAVQDKMSFGAKVGKQIVGNLVVHVTCIDVRLKDSGTASEFGIHVDSVFVGSPPADPTATPPAVPPLLKQVGFQGLAIDGGSSVAIQPILRPLGLRLILFQDELAGEVRLDFALGVDPDAGVVVSQTQIGLLAAVGAALGEQSARLQALLHPPGVELLVDLGSADAVKKTKGEYLDLLRRGRKADLELPPDTPDLESADKWRLQTLQDLVPEDMQSTWSVVVFKEAEEVSARRAEKETASTRWFGMRQGGAKEGSKQDALSGYREDLERLRREAEQLGAVPAPSRLVLHVELQQFSLELENGAGEQILKFALLGLALRVEATTRPDHRGVPTADFQLGVDLTSVNAMHGTESLLRFGSSNVNNIQDSKAVQLVLANRLEAERTVFEVSLDCAPLELFFLKTLVPGLKAFQEATARTLAEAGAQIPKVAINDEQKQRAIEEMDKYFVRGEEWLDSECGKDAMNQARQRIPDAVELHVHLCGPRVSVPIGKMGTVSCCLGNFTIETPTACTYQEGLTLQVQVALSDIAILVSDGHGRDHSVFAPCSLKASLELGAEVVSISGGLEGFRVEASPELARTILAVPQVVLASLHSGQAADSPSDASRSGQEQEETRGRASTLVSIIANESVVAKRAQKAFEDAWKQAKNDEELLARTVRASFTLGSSTVLLLDAATSVLRIHVACKELEAVYTSQTAHVPMEITAKLTPELSVDMFNVRVGRFEPVLEPFCIDINLSQEGSDKRTARLQGREPLLLNVTPTTVRFMSWYIPHFLTVIEASMASEDVEDPVRYRVLNLTSGPVGLHLPDGRREIEPTGASCRSLDEWLVPARCDRVTFDDDSTLRFVEEGAVLVPGGPQACLAQVLRTRPGYALLLLASPRLLFNDTTLSVRVACPSETSPQARKALAPASCASAAVLQGEAGADDVDVLLEALATGGELRPGAFASIPVEGNDGGLRCEVSCDGNAWSGILEVEPGALQPVCCGDKHFLVAFEASTSAPPACLKLLRARLLPALRLASALPGDLEVEYRQANEDEGKARRAVVPTLGEVAVYDVATPCRLLMRARMTGGAWSRWATFEAGGLGAGAEKEVELAREGTGAASLTISPREGGEIVFFCTSWLIDRTGWAVTVTHGGTSLPVVDGISLCSSSLDNYALVSDGKAGQKFSIPAASTEWGFTALSDGRGVCARSTPVPWQETRSSPVRCIELVPRLTVHNAAEGALEFEVGETTVKVPPGESAAPHFKGHRHFVGSYSSDNYEVRFRSAAAAGQACSPWSPTFQVSETHAGVAPASISGKVWTVEMRTERGMLCVFVREGSDYSIYNSLGKACELRLRGLPAVTVPAGEERAFAWADPAGKDADRNVEIAYEGRTIEFDPRVAMARALGSSVKIVSVLRGACTRLEVVSAAEAKVTAGAMRLELVMPKIGASLVGESGGASELLYVEVQYLRVSASMRADDDVQFLDVSVGDVQVDWQSAAAGVLPVVVGNCGLSKGNAMKPFARCALERGRTSSPDMYLRSVRVEIDGLEVGVNDKLLAGLSSFSKDLAQGSVRKQVSVEDSAIAPLRRSAGVQLVAKTWEPPPLRKVVQVDHMFVSAVSLRIWCTLPLASLTFMPKWAQLLLSALTFSGDLVLEGSRLALSPKDFNGIRGSAVDCAQSLVREYLGDVIQSLGSVLGRSSLLNIPRAPLQLGVTVVGAVAGAVGAAAGTVDKAVFDHQVGAGRSAKKSAVKDIGEGMSEAFSEIGDGMDGMLDVLRKPMEGAREGGVGGFVKGVGEGLLSGVAKPATALGHAYADVSSGVAAQVGSIGHQPRQVTKASRLPRLLAGPLGAVVEYSSLDAWVARTLGGPIEAVIPLRRLHASEDGAVVDMVLALVVAPDAVKLVRLRPPNNIFEEEGLLKGLKSVQEMAKEAEGIGIAGEQPSGSAAASSGRSPRKAECRWHGVLPLGSVCWCSSDGVGAQPEIDVESKGANPFCSLPAPWSLGNELPEAIFAVLRKATSADSIRGDWAAQLRAALSLARRAAAAGAAETSQTCIVYQVQRCLVAAGSRSHWLRPFLPTEVEHQDVWIEETMKSAHPLLDLDGEYRSASIPPIKMLPIWMPAEAWWIVSSSITDEDGWEYATNWSSSLWRPKPRVLFDTVRRRQWRRKYQLVSEPSSFEDTNWMDATFERNFWASLFCCLDSSRRRRHNEGEVDRCDKPLRPSAPWREGSAAREALRVLSVRPVRSVSRIDLVSHINT